MNLKPLGYILDIVGSKTSKSSLFTNPREHNPGSIFVRYGQLTSTKECKIF